MNFPPSLVHSLESWVSCYEQIYFPSVADGKIYMQTVFAKLIFVEYLHKANKSVYVIYSLLWWNSGKITIEISHRYFMWVFMWPFSRCSSSFDFALLGTGFPGGSTVKNLPASAGHKGDAGLNPGSRRSPGEGNDNHSSILALENPTDSRVRQATVHGVSKSRTWLSDSTTTTTELSGGSRRGIFGWLPKHLGTFPPLVCILGTFKDLVPQVRCHFLLCQVNIFLFQGGFLVLPASQVQWALHSLNVGTHSLGPWQEILVIFSFSKKKKCKNNSLFKNKSSICLKRKIEP